MEKHWVGAKPLLLQAITTGIIVAGTVFMLSALVSTLTNVAGALTGEAVVAVMRELLSPLGVFIPHHELPEMWLPPFLNPFLGRVV